MRVLITGASGFVGSHLGRALAARHEVLGIVFHTKKTPSFGVERADLRDARQLRTVVERFRPQAIVHAAAMSRVLGCEEDGIAAEDVNVEGTARMVRLAEVLHAKFVFLSTDQVFSGRRGGYRESDEPDPINVYGRTKLEAERLVLGAALSATVLRCNSVLGQSHGWGESFADHVRLALEQSRTITLFTDQYRSPLHVRALVQLIEAVCTDEFSGLLHVGGIQRRSRLDTGYAVARAYGLSSASIIPGSVSDHPRAEIMSRDGSFDSSRMRRLFPLLALRSIDDELRTDAESLDK